MVCGSGALASSPPPPPIRAVRASSQASRAAGASRVVEWMRRRWVHGSAGAGRAGTCVQAAGGCGHEGAPPRV